MAATLLALPACAPEGPDVEGSPFGQVRRADLVRLEKLVADEGVDLFPELQQALEGNEAALERIFGLSRTFSRFDQAARTYGHLLHSSLLPLGERYGLARLAQIIERQPPLVRQRVRDFLYFDATRGPDHEVSEARVRASAPQLFPPEYTFGAGDSLFRRE